MGIIPPDPGVVVPDPSRAIALAKHTVHDALTGGFRREGEVRWLRLEHGRLLASAWPELRVSAETHAALKGALDPVEGTFEAELDGVRGLCTLAEDGFVARVVPA